ncbi:MAG TPA: phosphoribosylglycinamide formyltransferase [Chloroflexi bacterium]|jgi:phosphoribosylglycinamide formyltransferase-1|nr:phosphoribosylglycinamide formyltransferase [Chloroflexota bacterium]
MPRKSAAAPGPTLRLGFLASHGGSNMQAIIDACKEGRLDATPCVVISNNSNSMALERARREGIPCVHLSRVTHPDPDALDRAVLDTLRKHEVNLVVLAGYMKKLGPRTLAHYQRRILNIHPALLPRYGGKGMYGQHVHEAVLAAGESETGVTIHLVNENYDQGPIIAQRRVPVLPGDTVESLAERVLEQEHRLYAETLQRIARGEIDLDSAA